MVNEVITLPPEGIETIAASYGLKKTASGEYEKVDASDNASNKTD